MAPVRRLSESRQSLFATSVPAHVDGPAERRVTVEDSSDVKTPTRRERPAQALTVGRHRPARRLGGSTAHSAVQSPLRGRSSSRTTIGSQSSDDPGVLDHVQYVRPGRDHRGPEPALARNGVPLDSRDEELALVEAATGTYRKLAAADPQTYLPDLARALTNLGMLLSRVNWELALPPAREATEIYRQLTRSNLRSHPDVAGALSNLLTFLTEMGSCVGLPSQAGPSASPAPLMT